MFVLGKIKALTAAAVIAVAANTGAAKAVTLDITDIGSSFTVDFNYFDTLLAEFKWTLTSIAGSVWNFTVDLDNNSSNSPNENRITSFGFSTTPNVTVALTDTDGGLWTGVSTDPTAGYQNIAGGIEDCVRSGANNCQGGGGGGVSGGGTSSLGLALTQLTPSDTLTFDAFAVRFQSINVNGNTSLAFEGFVPPTTPIPLPAAGWLMVCALGGLAALRRRRQMA